MTIADMHLSRQATKQLTGSAFIAPLNAAELTEIEDWIRGQKRAKAPDKPTWKQLWEDWDIFFRTDLERRISRYVVSIIRSGADAINDPTTFENWSAISPFLRFFLPCTDPTQMEIYEAENPVLVGYNNEVWRIGFGKDQNGKPTTELVEPCPAGTVEDVLAVLLWSWEKDRPKAKLARERLCDLVARCVADRRFATQP